MLGELGWEGGARWFKEKEGSNAFAITRSIRDDATLDRKLFPAEALTFLGSLDRVSGARMSSPIENRSLEESSPRKGMHVV